jgi:hypothetical protein
LITQSHEPVSWTFATNCIQTATVKAVSVPTFKNLINSLGYAVALNFLKNREDQIGAGIFPVVRF